MITKGEILTTRPHPDGDHLWIATVSTNGRTRQIIYGGTAQLTPGDIVPVALPGTIIAGKTIRKKNIRGENSDGMLCSAAEAGLGDQTGHVHILNPPPR
jgi:phenylalanyl-tRNA synthetase beta chain